MKPLDTTDRVCELFLELSNKLMRDHDVTPEQIARVATGLAVHMHLEYASKAAADAAAHLRESADALDALCAPQPPSSIN
jgi:hypothetical protein